MTEESSSEQTLAEEVEYDRLWEPPKDLLLGDLEAVITRHARRADRSQQVAIGPSELGQSCERRLALGLLGADKINDDRDEWTSTVGTALHTWMEGALHADNERLVKAGLPSRWLIERTVNIEIGLDGHCDAYDLWTHTVLDHKFPGVTSIRKYRKNGHPGKQYEWQAQLYAMGWAKLGLPVRTTAICMYPRSGLIRDSWFWSTPYNPATAEMALSRKDSLLTGMDIAETMDSLPDFMSMLDRDTENCSWCPYHSRTNTDPTRGCAGPFEDLDYEKNNSTIVPGIL